MHARVYAHTHTHPHARTHARKIPFDCALALINSRNYYAHTKYARIYDSIDGESRLAAPDGYHCRRFNKDKGPDER